MRRICPTCLEELEPGAARCRRHNEAPDPLVGSVLDGRYRVSRRVSVGRSSAVYEGTDLKLARHLVLKTLLSPQTGHARWRDRILTKVRTLASLEHPNVVAIHDYAELGDDVGLCLVSEKLKGHSTAYHLDRSGRYDLRVAARVTLQAAYALGAGHARDISHGDVSTENLFLLHRSGRDDFVKLLNFASSVPLGHAAGSLDYACPHVSSGGAPDDRSDIYSLAMVTYALVCGRPAFPFRKADDSIETPEPPRQLRPELPPEAEEALLLALSADPARRPVAIEVFAKTFSRAVLDTTAAVRAFADDSEEDTTGVGAPKRLHPGPLTPPPAATHDELDETASIVIPHSFSSIVLDGE